MGLLWTIVGILVPVLVGIGFTFGTMSDADTTEFWVARLCFMLSMTVLTGTTFLWAIKTDWHVISRAVVCCLVGALVFLVLPESIRWVNNRESGFVGKKNRAAPKTTPISFAAMTNDQLRGATMTFVSRLRKFNSEFQTADRRIRDKEWNDSSRQSMTLTPEERAKPEVQARLNAEWNAQNSRMMERRNKFQDSFKSNFLVDAGLLEQELKKRVDPGALTGLGTFTRGGDTLKYGGMLAGPDPVGDVASYLESLAKQLPADE